MGGSEGCIQRVERRLSILTICRGASTRSVVRKRRNEMYKKRQVPSQRKTKRTFARFVDIVDSAYSN